MQKLVKVLCFILIFNYVLVLVLAKCDSCLSNNVACINSTHFKVCYDGVRNDDEILHCEPGEVCTERKAVCMDEDVASPACGKGDVVANCPDCDGSALFVCTSRTTFQMCNGLEMTSQKGTCKADKVCSIRSGLFCVDECSLDGVLECNKTAT